MPVHVQHDQLANNIYFITFTFYKWLPLIEKTNAYDAVYKWFDVLQAKGVSIAGYVIMPNHVHVLLHFPEMLNALHSGVSKRERKKERMDRYTKYLKKVLTGRIVILQILFFRNLITCITIR